MTTLAQSGEVSHDTLLELMVTLFLGWPTMIAFMQARSRRRDKHSLYRQLDVIHGLVNHNLEDTKRRELRLGRVLLATVIEVVAMKEKSGIEVLPETYDLLQTLPRQIDALARDLGNQPDPAEPTPE